MRKMLLLVVALAGFVLGFRGNREVVFRAVSERLPDWQGMQGRLASFGGSRLVEAMQPPLSRRSRLKPRKWTFADGSEIDAVLLAADAENVQFRVSGSQGVGQVKLGLLAERDRDRIRAWVESDGVDGVAGFPLRLKNHRWPEQWRGGGNIPLERIGGDRWRSPHFEILDRANVKPEALESITLICESVDGALNALPLPLPTNWGRSPDELRKIVIERKADSSEFMENRAGYWDGRTGTVHINADELLEPDLQLVVFEFDRPEKVQRYDVIVHEVTHQSTAALVYLGAPTWVLEGIAEYMSATQFAPAFFQFGNSHVSVRRYINKQVLGDRIVKDRRMNAAHLELLMNRDLAEWNAVVDAGDVSGLLQYNEALLLVDYFFHRDHPDGLHFRRYLEGLLSGVPEREARDRHLMRGRSYRDLEREIADLWKPLGFTFNFQGRSELSVEDVAIDWNAEEVRRTIASRKAMVRE
ncbi:MAG TPA: hypothetical protein PLA50_03045 [Bacteroidia bacterium]|nr:hypothetical protein [Bacteroidia bacterium]